MAVCTGFTVKHQGKTVTWCKLIVAWALIMLYDMSLNARKPVFGGFANNKGEDQPAHPRRLISAYIFRLLESIISKLATSLSLALWETPKTGFFRDEAHISIHLLQPVSVERAMLRSKVNVTPVGDTTVGTLKSIRHVRCRG